MDPNAILTSADAWRYGLGSVMALITLSMLGGLGWSILNILRGGLERIISAHEASSTRIVDALTKLQAGQQQHALDLAEIKGRLFTHDNQLYAKETK